MSTENDSIDYFNYKHPLRRFVSKLSAYFRDSHYRAFERLLRPRPEDSVVDVGVTPDESLDDSNFFVARYPHRDRILATSIEDAGKAMANLGVRFQRTPAGPLPFRAAEFDVAISWAVLEHVGSHASQAEFVNEIARIGRRFFVITPYRGFPLETHTLVPFLHWLPDSVYRFLFRKMGLAAFADEAHLNLLWKHDARAIARQIPGAKVVLLRLAGIIPSHLAIYRS